MKLQLSSSPHVRSSDSTRSIMYDVIIALIPATAIGVYRFGIYSAAILAVAVGFAVLSEYMYQNLTNQPVTIFDGSAVVTGLMLGLNLPPTVPLWIPALGSMFAIVVCKQFFGGLGKNFMNPALGGRIFLLISFTGIMSNFALDASSGATPLSALLAGEAVDIPALLVGFKMGVIGEVSALAVIIGGIYLLVKRIITWEIPVAYIGSFILFIGLFGDKGFNLTYILAQLFAGGLMLGVWFMATDYVTSPITQNGKIIYGVFIGLITGLLRIYGVAAEGVSYAIVMGNLLVPLIEKVTIPKPFGFGDNGYNRNEELAGPISYRPAINLAVITLISGLCLGLVYQVTQEPIRKAEMEQETAAFAVVCPQAASFDEATDIMDKADSLNGKFGDVVIDKAYASLDESGKVNGYVIVVTTNEGFGGTIQTAVGLDAEAKVTGIHFLSIAETAGLGMNADTDDFKNQYVGKAVENFTVTKDGAKADNEIDAISGATFTSNAVTNSVNTAISAVRAVVG